MARIKNLDSLKRQEAQEIALSELPRRIKAHDYVIDKGYKINELVKKTHGGSYEWYGFLLAKKDDIYTTIDVGLGENASNSSAFTKIEAEKIQEFLATLPEDYIINGWIHSHGNLNFRHFSGTDDRNMETVLSFASLVTRRPIKKKQILVDDLSLLVEGAYDPSDLKKGSVSVVLEDGKAAKAKIFETVFGSFCYSIVVGDEGWNESAICYERKSLLTGEAKQTKLEGTKEEPLVDIIKTDRKLEGKLLEDLEKEVKEKIKPYTYACSSGIGFKSREGYGGSPYYRVGEFEETETEGGTRLFLPKGKHGKNGKKKGKFRGFIPRIIPRMIPPFLRSPSKDDKAESKKDNDEKRDGPSELFLGEDYDHDKKKDRRDGSSRDDDDDDLRRMSWD